MSVMTQEFGVDLSRKMDDADRAATQAFLDDMTQEWGEVYDANYGRYENHSPEWYAVVEELVGISKFATEAQDALQAGILPW